MLSLLLIYGSLLRNLTAFFYISNLKILIKIRAQFIGIGGRCCIDVYGKCTATEVVESGNACDKNGNFSDILKGFDQWGSDAGTH